MTKYQRACQLWAILVLAAKNHQVLTYDLVARATGLPRFAVGRCLSPIQRYCELRPDLPLLNALVVNEIKGMPGEGYHHAPEDSAEKLHAEREKIFQKDWLDEKAPSAADFREADLKWKSKHP